MGLFKKMNPKFLFKTGKLPNLKEYVGAVVTIPGDPPIEVKINRIVGNVFKPQFYEINDKHLIGMLRFHAQMVKDTSITEEQFVAFEEMEMEAETMPSNMKPSGIGRMRTEGEVLAEKIMRDIKNEQKQSR